jgi:hypothetical protein
MDVSDDEYIVDDLDVRNIDISGLIDRIPDTGATLCFVTYLEIVKLLIVRKEQIDDISGKYNRIAPSVVDRCGENASLLVLLLAELMDPSIEYPLLVERGGNYLAVHKDLKLLDPILDMIVLTNENGEVSFNSVRTDILEKPGAENVSMLKDIADLTTIRMNMARHTI